uniref:Probable U2 small nuclear ribonucleoprotein A' n=1 Tax=Lygus hesperus TaxID=30085 RepID=A0A0A9YS56_LYGHE
MVKLTPELIQQAMQYMNPVRDREIDLRGYKIPVIENLGATLDQFDTIDFSDNDIRKLDGFPLLKRLKTLILNNNRIVRLADGLGTSIPNLENLILSGNNLQELSDIDPLISLQKLTTLSLLENPIVTKPHYRLYVAFKLPNLAFWISEKLDKRKEKKLCSVQKQTRQTATA